MDKTNRPLKKSYRRPVLQRYGDLRALTGGGSKTKDETSTIATQKTRLGSGG